MLEILIFRLDNNIKLHEEVGKLLSIVVVDKEVPCSMMSASGRFIANTELAVPRDDFACAIKSFSTVSLLLVNTNIFSIAKVFFFYFCKKWFLLKKTLQFIVYDAHYV